MKAFQDQSHIDRIRDALWANDRGGASVMIGSGFSRNALKVRPDAADPPMLTDVANELYMRLYPRTGEGGLKAKKSETYVADRILSLAQEYEAAFGRSDLHRLLQQLIRDKDLKPGEAHSRLLKLPWRDVFTTNWDTLLERTRPQVVAQPYYVVQDMDEIPFADKPRIVKLHGSLPSQFPLIFTEEDYRTYPTTFAPFVNTVQQAMMETVFCLMGFSGNDPNFLNWSGWVRDNLGSSAPKIYLAGWLDLPHHRRNMLERRGVVPIDLALHPRAHEWPEHQRHRCAIEWVLHTLERGRPHDLTNWPLQSSHPYSEIPTHLQPVVEVTSKQPQKEPRGDEREPKLGNEKLQKKVKGLLKIWQHNREVYPGWLLLPAGEGREIFRSGTNNWEPLILAALPNLEVVERLNAIYELIWRREILLEPISEKLESAIERTLTTIDCQGRKIDGVDVAGINWTVIREKWRNAAIALITAARFRLDSDLFDKRVEALEPFENDHPDVHHRLKQERCLRAVYSMEFETLGVLLDDWMVTDSDPIWMIRKAALLWESVRNDEGEGLVKQALDAVRSMPDEDGSFAGASREGWALWSVYTLDNRREIFKRWVELAPQKCDAMLERDIVARQVSGTEESREAPSFDLGVRRVKGFRFSSWRPEVAAYRAVRLTEITGLPPFTRHTELLDTPVGSSTLRPAAEALATFQPELAIRLALRVSNAETDETLNRVLTRARAATLSEPSADLLSDICINAIRYAFPRLTKEGGRKGSFPWITRMRVATEVVSRLALRVTPERVESFLDMGIQCFRSREVAKELWLHKSVENLLRRSWKALPKDRRAARAVDLLSLPIVGMDNFSANIADIFPDPGGLINPDDLPSERTPDIDGQWHDTVNFLIRGLEGDGEARKRALERIRIVFNRELLTETELSEFAQALWSDRHTSTVCLPDGTRLYDWEFLSLPEPKSGLAAERFRLKWLSRDTYEFQKNKHGDSNTDSVSWGESPVRPDRIEDVLWNVGGAIAKFSNRERPLQLSEEDRKHVLKLVEKWIGLKVSSYVHPSIPDGSRESTEWALSGLVWILEEVEIPTPIGERLYGKLKELADSGMPGFELIHGLVKAIPDQIDALSTWLRMGLASDDEAVVASALSGLRIWLTASADTETSRHPPPTDLLREVGFTIACRRRVALPKALQLATWVFREGTSENQQTIVSLVTQGLSYLAEGLRYDHEQGLGEGDDQPLLRLLCVQLAQSMAQSGLMNEPTVELWLKIGAEDPLPETRYAVEFPDDSGNNGPK